MLGRCREMTSSMLRLRFLFLRPRLGAVLLGIIGAGSTLASSHAAEPGLLFYLSGEQETVADYSAGGTPKPNLVFDVTTIPDGAKGKALSCAPTQVLSYWAPGNIYAQRGTLAFFWRSRDPVGPTEFPIFRVAYADHSSWDMVWLRIDYNGHGFDAFVTDAGLARTRVSYNLPSFPKPNEWVHLAVSWDETTGLRFYVNGQLAAEKRTVAVYDAALDQFGPHSRIISPHQVQSDYNYVRGGDLDELRIYDHALPDAAVAALAKNDLSGAAAAAGPVTRRLTESRWREEWQLRYGWNRPDDPPPALPASSTTVRKVEIHDAYDQKRWWWKANDGIRETTWPGVYNRSRLPGRNDYFQLPDWDCYSTSGKAITFSLPNEPWNHLEIAGPAWGRISLVGEKMENGSTKDTTLFERPRGQEVTVHVLAEPRVGGQVRFDNVEPEEPIQEFAAYYVHPGAAPEGKPTLTYALNGQDPATQAAEAEIQASDVQVGAGGLPAATAAWLRGRYAADERQIMIAQPIDRASAAPSSPRSPSGASLPIVHVLIPSKSDVPGYNLNEIDGGLDGIVLELPGLAVKPTHGGRFALNLQVKDPLWPLRNLLDFTFTVKPSEPVSLWLDLRDRILPADMNLSLTLAGAGPDFSRESLVGAKIRLVFKSREAARAEHELDRFTQARDCYAMLVEERPHDPRFNLWNRYERDLKDLLRINPKHDPGINYASASGVDHSEKPVFQQPEQPEGIPLWAFRQVKVLEGAKRFALWYVDHRQIENGEFGGGISDDTDLLNIWPGLILMGAEPDRLRDSLKRLLQAAYNNGMFTRGLPAIQADELHSYEEGINALGENLIADFGNPQQLERTMENARGVMSITGVNAAGHRHIRSSYYSGSRVAEDEPWGYSKTYSYLVLQPGMLLVDYNGNPLFKKTVIELADGLLAHGTKGPKDRYVLPRAIHFATDQAVTSGRYYFPGHVFWTSYLWTGDKKYLTPIMETSETAALALNSNVLDVLHLRDQWTANDMAASDPSFPEKRARGDVRPARGYLRENRDTAGLHFAWQLSGDKTYLETLYANQLEQIALFDYINTEGSLWIDRVGVPTAELQRARLGGVALVRNAVFPGHTVSWRFSAPATEQSLAILLPASTPTEFKVIAYNLETHPVTAELTGWQVEPGVWEITQGIDTQAKDEADQDISIRAERFERSRSVELTFPPRATTVLTFKRKTPGTPYHQRPDLGLGREDIVREDGGLKITVHSLGAVATPEASIVVKSAAGQVLGSAKIAALEAPLDLLPKTAVVEIKLPKGTVLDGATVEIDPDRQVEEITILNNRVRL